MCPSRSRRWSLIKASTEKSVLKPIGDAACERTANRLLPRCHNTVNSQLNNKGRLCLNDEKPLLSQIDGVNNVTYYKGQGQFVVCI